MSISNKVRTLLSFGETLWDLLPEGKVPGGAPMNVAMHLHQRGANISFLSRVGNDALGEELLAYIHNQGLKADLMQRDEVYPTGRVNVDVSDPTEVKYDIELPAAWDFIDIKAEDLARMSNIDVVLYGSLAARNGVSRNSLLNLLSAANLKVFDVNLRPPFTHKAVIEPLMQAANWVKLNHHELELLSEWYGIKGNHMACTAKLGEKFGLDIICITLGADGAMMMKDGKFYRQSGFKVKVADTIGSGDSFLAAWLHQMLSGAEPQYALKYACALGALVATHHGANPKIKEEDIIAFMEAGSFPSQIKNR